MNVQTIQSELTAAGVRVTLTDAGTLFLTPKEKITPDIIAKVKEHKPELVAALSRKPLPADFERRYIAMCKRWQYTTDETAEGLEAARLDPAKALLCMIADEQRTDADRARWLA